MKKDINLPAFNNSLPAPGPLNMEDYLEFVLLSLRSFPQDAGPHMPIPTRFVIRDGGEDHSAKK